MIKSNSSTLDTSRRKTRTLFPRLPNTSNLSVNPQSVKDLTSRTIEACRRCGIETSQIIPPDYDRHPLFNPNSAQNKSTPESVLELRRTFAEKERLHLLKQVDFVRRNLIDDNWKESPKENPDSLNSGSFDCKSAESQRVMTPKRRKARDSFIAKREGARIKKAREKAVKINTLMSHKWESEAKRVRKQKMLQRSNSLIEATRRHEEHMQSLLMKTKSKNQKIREKSIKAREAIEKAVANRNLTIQHHLKLEQKQMELQERKQERQRMEYSKRQQRRFRQHRLAHRRVVHQEKVQCKKQHRSVQHKHKIARKNQQERDRKFKEKKVLETKRKQEKIIKAREMKKRREEQRKNSVMQNIERVQKRMQEVAEEKAIFREKLRQRALLKNSKAGKVMLANEKQRKEFEQQLKQRDTEAEQRLAFYRQQKQEELMLRKELGNLRKQQRALQVKREKKADEYERARLERKLQRRDEKLALREETRTKFIAKQRRYNDKQRLLRAELSYEFLHLSEDKITSPVAITKFSSRLTGKTPKLSMRSKMQLSDRLDESSMKTEEE